MSYPMDINDYSEHAIAQELSAREQTRAQGLCDYCRRRPSTPDCRFPVRHHDERIRETEACLTCGGSGLNNEERTTRHYCIACDGKGIDRESV